MRILVGAPVELREGIRRGILASIRKDVELRGGRTARLLVLSGVVGVLGALGVTLMIARHPFGHHPPWHVTVVSTVWAGILVVVSATALLQVRTPTLALSRAAIIGMLGLGLAGLCGAVPRSPFSHLVVQYCCWILDSRDCGTGRGRELLRADHDIFFRSPVHLFGIR